MAHAGEQCKCGFRAAGALTESLSVSHSLTPGRANHPPRNLMEPPTGYRQMQKRPQEVRLARLAGLDRARAKILMILFTKVDLTNF